MAAIALTAMPSHAQTCWSIADDGHSISLDIKDLSLPYDDHIEMSGEQISCVLRWGIDDLGHYHQERSLVFPMLRRIPNDTHASLLHRNATDIMSLVTVNSLVPKQIGTIAVSIDGTVNVTTSYAVGKANIGGARGSYLKPAIEVSMAAFPSTSLPVMCETYTLKNISGNPLTVLVPELSQVARTPRDKGVDGAYVVRADIIGSGTYVAAPGESIVFHAIYQAYRDSSERMLTPDVAAEHAARMAFISKDIDAALILETPEPAIDAEFRFAKIRASESIYRTKGGLMHGPGGESYYAALWCNDECEYVSPFYPYLGYRTGNESALNCYRHYARYMNDAYNPIPSSIIAEGIDIWDGAGDRGDAAMVAHGASRYVLTRGDKAEAQELWPFIKWCLEYCRLKLNADGVPESDSDELEGRFPSGDANLSTACLYYDGLVSAAYLSKELGEPASVAASYRKQAEALRKAIGRHFSANVSGFDTYRYYDGNDVLRSWICLPLCFGINDRAEGTLQALFSPLMMTEDGILTQQGSETFWDRSTLYALRGAFAAGYSDQALEQLLSYSKRRLTGIHVPYPIEAWPEGSQRHLSGESGLYCRIVTEGLFGIRPTGLSSFNLKVQMPTGWDEMALRHIKAFGGDFDIEAHRVTESKIEVKVSSGGRAESWTVAPGQEIKNITLK